MQTVEAIERGLSRLLNLFGSLADYLRSRTSRDVLVAPFTKVLLTHVRRSSACGSPLVSRPQQRLKWESISVSNSVHQ